MLSSLQLGKSSSQNRQHFQDLGMGLALGASLDTADPGQFHLAGFLQLPFYSHAHFPSITTPPSLLATPHLCPTAIVLVCQERCVKEPCSK
jgi:hypothetical protein